MARHPKTSPQTERRPRERAPLRRALCAVVAGACASIAGASPASAAAESPTPQAIAANAAFLAYAPPPPTPVKVCVVDTGVDLNTDAAPAVVERYAVDGGTLDDVGGGGLEKHGTYVAGTIASQRDGRGSVGIWPHAKVVSVRVFDPETGTTSVAAYLKALDTCRDAGARVVNLSLSGLDEADSSELAQLENRIGNLRANKAIDVVAAAGNSGGAVGYPARFGDVFAVGAANGSGALCSFSSRGDFLDITALGCGVKLSLPDGATGTGNGTSLAAPIVSAALAALRAYDPAIGVEDAENLLVDTARTGGAGSVLDIAAAFRRAGLGTLVETPAPRPPALRAVAPTATQGTPTTAAPASGPLVVQAVGQPGATDALAEMGVHRPRIRSARFRHGVLRVVTAGIPDFGRAVFTVDRRRYTRASGNLTVRLRHAPSRASVVVVVPGVGRTAPVRIRLRIAGRR